MADLGATFDATTVSPDAPRDLLPAGKYNAQIINSEMKPTKSGTGSFLWLELEVIDGPHARQHLFDRLNLVNQNETAVDIAKRALSAICHAVGKLQVSNSDQLHFLPLSVTVKVKPGDGQYGPSNEIGGYAPLGGAAPAAASTPRPAAQQQNTAPAAAAAKIAPWAVKKAATAA